VIITYNVNDIKNLVIKDLFERNKDITLDDIKVIDENTVNDSYPVIPNFIIKVEIQ